MRCDPKLIAGGTWRQDIENCTAEAATWPSDTSALDALERELTLTKQAPAQAHAEALAAFDARFGRQLLKQEAAFATLEAKLQMKDAAQPWYRRVFNDTDEVDALQAQVASSSKGLAQMREVAAFAHTLSLVIAPLQARTDETNKRSALVAAIAVKSAAPEPEWRHAVTMMLESASWRSAKTASDDWHAIPPLPATLTSNNFARALSATVESARPLEASDRAALVSAALRSACDQRLRAIDAGYEARTNTLETLAKELAVLKNVETLLVDTENAARSAAAAVSARDLLRHSEPSKTNLKGKPSFTHAVWSMSYSAAKVTASAELSRASHAAEVANRAIAALPETLRSDAVLSPVRTRTSPTLASLVKLPVFSLDSFDGEAIARSAAAQRTALATAMKPLTEESATLTRQNDAQRSALVNSFSH